MYQTNFTIGHFFFVKPYSERLAFIVPRHPDAFATQVPLPVIHKGEEANLNFTPRLVVNRSNLLELQYQIFLADKLLSNYTIGAQGSTLKTTIREFKHTNKDYDTFALSISNKTEEEEAFAPVFPALAVPHQELASFENFKEHLSYFLNAYPTKNNGLMGYEIHNRNPSAQKQSPFRDSWSMLKAMPSAAIGGMGFDTNYLLEWIAQKVLHAFEISQGYDVLGDGTILQRLISFPAILGVSESEDKPNYWYFQKSATTEQITYQLVIAFSEEDNIKELEKTTPRLVLEIELGEKLSVEQAPITLPLSIGNINVIADDNTSPLAYLLKNCAIVMQNTFNKEQGKHSGKLGRSIFYKSITPRKVTCFDTYYVDFEQEFYYFFYKTDN